MRTHVSSVAVFPSQFHSGHRLLNLRDRLTSIWVNHWFKSLLIRWHEVQIDTFHYRSKFHLKNHKHYHNNLQASSSHKKSRQNPAHTRWPSAGPGFRASTSYRHRHRHWRLRSQLMRLKLTWSQPAPSYRLTRHTDMKLG